MSEVTNKSNITFRIGLDKDKMPTTIHWMADGNPNGKVPEPAKAIMLSLFDGDNKETKRIDIWTKEFQIEEMNQFMFESLNAMADTYHKATKNDKLANDIKMFAHFFGQEVGLLKKEEKK